MFVYLFLFLSFTNFTSLKKTLQSFFFLLALSLTNIFSFHLQFQKVVSVLSYQFSLLILHVLFTLSCHYFKENITTNLFFPISLDTTFPSNLNSLDSTVIFFPFPARFPYNTSPPLFSSFITKTKTAFHSFFFPY